MTLGIWGGVLALVWSSIPCWLQTDLAKNSPDLIVLDFDTFLVLCAYVPPHTGYWQSLQKEICHLLKPTFLIRLQALDFGCYSLFPFIYLAHILTYDVYT